ncbi:hypothetical protein TcCL_NonESM03528 [Trypanosoma cruzi]|nr:hypothetical protein TcCL_NonESM03528 [Trypanosoma cruzi]
MVMKLMEKRSSALSQGSCPSAVSPFTSMRPAATPGSALWCNSPNIELCSGEGRTGRRAPPTARSRVDPNRVSPQLEQRASTLPVLWNAPWHPRSQSSCHLCSRKFRELLVASKCPA